MFSESGSGVIPSFRATDAAVRRHIGKDMAYGSELSCTYRQLKLLVPRDLSWPMYTCHSCQRHMLSY